MAKKSGKKVKKVAEAEEKTVTSSVKETAPAEKKGKGKGKTPKAEKTAPVKADKGDKKVKKGTGKAKGEAKVKGEKKPRESKVKKDKFGFREGSKKSAAAAMYSNRKTKGATLTEVKEALDSSQLNLLKELEERGYTITKSKEEGKGKKPVTRYLIKAEAKETGAE